MNVGILDVETSEKPVLHPWMTGSYLSTIGLQMYVNGESYYREWVYTHSEMPNMTDKDRLQIVFDIQEEIDKLVGDGILVGHNFKFDMNWLKHVNVDLSEIAVHCTMLAEFMLSGQDKEELPLTSQDLSTCCERHGLPTKTDKVKAFWDAGYKTKDIPLKILLPYQKNDVDITADLFKSQYRQMIIKKKLFTLCTVRQQMLHCVTDIELNGMCFDKPLAEKWVKHFTEELDTTNAELRSYFGRDDINLGSGPELSACLFGGVLKRTRHVPLMYTRNVTVKEPFKFTYRSGKNKGLTITKYRNSTLRELTCKKRRDDYEISLPGIGFIPDPNTECKLNGESTGVYKTNKGVLANLKPYKTAGSTRKLKARVLELLVHRSKIAKFTESFVGVKPNTGLFYQASINTDGWLHPNYNQTIAATGRQTSSQPNGQNFPRSKEDADGFTNPLKSCFIPSRDGGLVLVIDLSQLEWRVAAWLSQDPVALKEIYDGVDIHSDNAIRFFGDIKYRQDAKIMTFRLLYGGTAYAFYMDPLMPDFSKKKWGDIVKMYNQKYAVLIAWQEDNIRQVPEDNGMLYSPLGRIYKIPQTEHKRYPGTMIYKPTCIKNYPVQGTATGDIVPLATNLMWDRMQASPMDYMSTNWMGQVHDSVLFDTMPHEVKRVAHMGISVFESLPKVISDMWGVDFNVPLTGEAEWGTSYANMTHSVSHEGDKWILKQKK